MSFRALLTAGCAAIAWCGVLGVAAPAGADTVTIVPLTFGNPNDVPITGDWDGSGKTQIGVYRPSTRTFYLREVTPPAPPPPPPIVTTPVTVPLPTPPRGTRRHPAVRVLIKISWTWTRTRTSTRIHRVIVGKLPRRATITLKCSGRGCPIKKRSAKAAHVGVFAHRLIGTNYRAGDRVFITVSAPGRVAERAVVTIRDGRKPLAALL